MQNNYVKCLGWLLLSEGGYVNDPRDPGGATNKGVTQRVYNGWRIRQHQQTQSVRQISPDEVSAIYKMQYWDAVRGDDMPSGVDYCLFDEGANSGPVRSIRDLQSALKIKSDGHIGLVTMQTVAGVSDRRALVNAVCDYRLSFLRRLRTFKFFGRGWRARVERVRVQALALVTV
jgi:lysozyme family protein